MGNLHSSELQFSKVDNHEPMSRRQALALAAATAVPCLALASFATRSAINFLSETKSLKSDLLDGAMSVSWKFDTHYNMTLRGLSFDLVKHGDYDVVAELAHDPTFLSYPGSSSLTYRWHFNVNKQGVTVYEISEKGTHIFDSYNEFNQRLEDILGQHPNYYQFDIKLVPEGQTQEISTRIRLGYDGIDQI